MDGNFDQDAEFDEYLWPLNGEASGINLDLLSEELRIRQRLAEIMAHVRETHLQPRLRRWASRLTCETTKAVAQAIVAGPEEGPPWEQALGHPVPRALRDEWRQLASRLRALKADRRRHSD
ncbi:MAG: hypothetical protein ACE5I7_00415 [Candidatus Binatia bacterium]